MLELLNEKKSKDDLYVGCISRLVVNNKGDIDIMKEKRDSEGVTSCETCAVNPCENNGVCQEAPTRLGYTCLCPRGYTGTNCSRNGEPCYEGAISLIIEEVPIKTIHVHKNKNVFSI